MPVFKNEDNGTWYVMARYVNWKGERKQKCKRGFATKKEAQEWERMFQLQNASVKADIFGFDITDVSGSIKLFSDVMKRLGIKLDGDELYEEFQRIYDVSVSRNADKEKNKDKMWNMRR